MKALINVANTKCKDLLLLLKDKIEECIISNSTIVLSVENPYMNCLTSINVEDYEVDIDNEKVYLSGHDFDLNIIVDDKTQIAYDDTYEEHFKILHKETEIVLNF